MALPRCDTWPHAVKTPIRNASRKQVNGALKRFAAAGWLQRNYRAITIRNVEALRRLADGDGAD